MISHNYCKDIQTERVLICHGFTYIDTVFFVILKAMTDNITGKLLSTERGTVLAPARYAMLFADHEKSELHNLRLLGE